MHIIFNVIVVVITAKIAEKQGRDVGWAILCSSLFSFFALIVYLLLGKTLEQRISDNLRKSTTLEDNLINKSCMN